MSPKSFQALIEEVHNKGICQECGGCVSFCSSAEYDIIAFKDPNKPPAYINKEKCLECGICYHICPQTDVLLDSLNQTYKNDDPVSKPIGFYENIFSCQAIDNDFLRVGTDGGVVNSIINYLLEEGMIDGAIVSKFQSPLSKETSIAYNKEDLINASGARLDMSPQLGGVQQFSTYTNSIQQLNHYKFKKLAVVGTPCQINTIRCMQDLGVTPSENIEICLGLFCYENFLFHESQIEKFEKDFNINFNDIIKVNIKEDLILKIKDADGGQRTVHIPFNHLNDYMRTACNACQDFTNIYADISFGGLSSQEKYTTVIPRTDKGINIFNKAKTSGIIKCSDLDNDKKSKMVELLTQFTNAKIKRKLEFMKNIE